MNPAGMAIGIAIGAAIGTAMGNLALGMGVGIAIGVAMGVVGIVGFASIAGWGPALSLLASEPASTMAQTQSPHFSEPIP